MLIDSNSTFSQNEAIGAVKDKVNKNIEDKFKATYNSTINKYGDGRGIIDPCKISDAFDQFKEVTKCGKVIGPED